MIKNLVKAVIAFSLLVGFYQGYVRAFAVVVERLRAHRRIDTTSFAKFDSNSKRHANELARSEFGPDHWSADPELNFRYYNSDRGFWMYAIKVIRVVEEDGIKYDGKRVRMAPFALIWKSRDGSSTKTILSDEAVFDLNEPLGLKSDASGESLKIKHAWIQKNVLIRDNRGTPRDPGDDMNIGPLTAVEYDEPTQQIKSQSDVVIQDREIRITGTGMLIQLRAKEPGSASTGSSAGFEGAETLYLYKNVHVLMRDVGKSGILPGSAPASRGKPARPQVVARGESRRDSADASAPAAAGPTPMDVRSDSTMRVDMPKPKPQVAVGPPERPAPTLVQFERNVVVLRGPADGLRDQLDCDTLNLTLIPGDPPPVATATADLPRADTGDSTGDPITPAPVPNDKGLFGDLTLQRAKATGHAVWLTLPAQGTKLRCNELIHKRLLPAKPDETYLSGDLARPLEIWKVDVVQDEGPDQGKVTSVTHIRTADATMFDKGNGLDSANVIARGPGRMETRPDRDQPVERIAVWQKQLDIQNLLDADGRIKQKVIVLSGNRPCFIDTVQKTSLDSAATIYVWLKPKPPAGAVPSVAASSVAATGTSHSAARPVALASSRESDGSDPNPPASPQRSAGDNHASTADVGGGDFQIERLLAHRDVHLNAPSKSLTARERLDAEFVDANPTPAGPGTSAGPAAASATAATNPPAAQAQAPPTTEKNASQPAEQNPPAPPPAPAEPLMIGSAQRIWALVTKSPDAHANSTARKRPAPNNSAAAQTPAATPGGLDSNSEVRKVWMWGNVALHQDPRPGKARGEDATGEAVYVDNRGPNKALTLIYQRDPSEKKPRPGPIPVARIENADINIAAYAGYAKMDQATDQAWVEGPGSMTQLAARGFLTDKAPTAEDAEADQSTQNSAAAPKRKTRAGRQLTEKQPMTITFTKRMEFTGRTVDPDGRPAARANFYGIVDAKMEDALLHCEEEMIAYTDKEVPWLSSERCLAKRPSPSKKATPTPMATRPRLATSPSQSRRPSSPCSTASRMPSEPAERLILTHPSWSRNKKSGGSKVSPTTGAPVNSRSPRRASSGSTAETTTHPKPTPRSPIVTTGARRAPIPAGPETDGSSPPRPAARQIRRPIRASPEPARPLGPPSQPPSPRPTKFGRSSLPRSNS